jgi:hypothetical protein
VLKKNRKFKMCVGFKKLNVASKKDPYTLPFTNEVFNIVTKHEVYTFLYGFLRYHHISIALKDQYKTTFVTNWGSFVWVIIPFRVKKGPSTYQKAVTKL